MSRFKIETGESKITTVCLSLDLIVAESDLKRLWTYLFMLSLSPLFILLRPQWKRCQNMASLQP